MIALIQHTNNVSYTEVRDAIKDIDMDITEIVVMPTEHNSLCCMAKQYANRRHIPIKEFKIEWERFDRSPRYRKQGKYGAINTYAPFHRYIDALEYADVLIAVTKEPKDFGAKFIKCIHQLCKPIRRRKV